MCSHWKQSLEAILAAWMILLAGPNGSAQQRAPLPDAVAEHAAKKAAGEIYGGRFALAKTADEKTALAEEIIAAGLKLQAGSADQYALLDVGREIAAGAGDAQIALSAARELAQRFDVLAVKLEADTLLLTARWARATPQRMALAEAAGEVIGKLVEAEKYGRAIRLCRAAQTSADRAREFRLARDFSGLLRELRTAEQQLEQYRDALAVLNDDPVEPEANFTAGRYLCFVRGDWERGVAMLALGSNEPLKAVAIMELQGAETAEEQAAIGDGWWDLAESREGREREVLRLRAGSWYRPAAPQLAGLAGLRVNQRLEQIEKLDREIPAAPTPAKKPPTPPLAVAPFDADTARQHQEGWAEYLGVPVEFENSIGMQFVLIPPGEFDMGSTEEEVARLAEEVGAAEDAAWYIRCLQYEAPKHRVRITKPFWLGRHEVTRGQFRRFVEDSGYQTEAERDGKGSHDLVDGQWKQDPRFLWNSDFGTLQTDDHPVVHISWRDATAFCQWLSEKEGEEYRLPTEAEWEFACRAGTTTRYSFGDDASVLGEYAWWAKNSKGGTQPVGQLRPNAFGLFDMHGNVWEWCADWRAADHDANSTTEDPRGPDSGKTRAVRGGCWFNDLLGSLRSMCRGGVRPGLRGMIWGFRVSKTVAP